MTPTTVRRLDALFSLMPVLLGGTPAPSEIDLAEKTMGQSFPSDYREFLQRYGGAMVGSLPIFGLRRAEVMGESFSSVVNVTERFRAEGWPLPEGSLIVSMDLAGNPIGVSQTGEIWSYDRDSAESWRVAPTFDAFVVQLLDESVPTPPEFRMRGITILEPRGEGTVPTVHPRDILACLGARGHDSIWVISYLECTGLASSELHHAAETMTPVGGRELSILAEGVDQVIDGDFEGYLSLAATAWITIRAIDCMAFDVFTSRDEVVALLKSRFSDVRDLPADTFCRD